MRGWPPTARRDSRPRSAPLLSAVESTMPAAPGYYGLSARCHFFVPSADRIGRQPHLTFRGSVPIVKVHSQVSPRFLSGVPYTRERPLKYHVAGQSDFLLRPSERVVLLAGPSLSPFRSGSSASPTAGEPLLLTASTRGMAIKNRGRVYSREVFLFLSRSTRNILTSVSCQHGRAEADAHRCLRINPLTGVPHVTSRVPSPKGRFSVTAN